jgi:exodeoxyribonuclease V gamma subunit
LWPTSEPRCAELISYDPDARRGALATMMRQDLDRHSGEVPLPGRDEPFLDQLSEEAQSKMRGALQIITPPHSSGDSAPAELSLPLSALRKFLECPLQGAAQYALGMIEDDDGAGEEHQDEPVAQSILDRTVLLRDVFWKARGNEAALANWYDSIFRIARTQGRAAAGPFGDAAETTDLKWLRQWLERATAGHLNLEKWKEVRIGRAHEFAATELLMPEISLTIPMPSPSGDIRERRVKIYGTAGYMSPSLDASMRCVLRKKSKPKDFLGPFLSGIALSAVGQIAGRFSAIVVGASRDGSWREMKTLMLPDQASAVSYLSNLVADLLSGTNHYFLPVEAVANAHESIEKGDLDRAIDKIETDRENEFAKVSSDYGPVRDARRFSPPDEETLRDIVQRRFGILRTIFVEEKQ